MISSVLKCAHVPRFAQSLPSILLAGNCEVSGQGASWLPCSTSSLSHVTYLGAGRAPGGRPPDFPRIVHRARAPRGCPAPPLFLVLKSMAIISVKNAVLPRRGLVALLRAAPHPPIRPGHVGPRPPVGARGAECLVVVLRISHAHSVGHTVKH